MSFPPEYYPKCEERTCTGKIGQKTYFCYYCDSNFCDPCWKLQVQHHESKKGPDNLPHEKTDRYVFERLRKTLEPSSNPEEQKTLHEADEETLWFGIGRNEADVLTFQDYGRYARIMADSLCQEEPFRYPQLVSFIGQTGDGKSTIIKLLIDNQEMRFDPLLGVAFPSPVVGSANENVPTSGDVHLYSAPTYYHSKSPLLYADCEGLDGGENIPIAARSSPSDKFLQRKIKPRGRQALPRKIRWADTTEKQKREYAVTELYPRLLYTFSDVVVFVLQNPKVFESTVLRKLLRWAEASLEKSLNQPALPHAIIVLNATDYSVAPDQWEVESATLKLMSDIEGALNRVPEFKEIADTWRRNGKEINTMKGLLECYYSSISVVRIPTKGRYMLIHEQVGKLHQEIVTKCEIAFQTKRNLRMLPNSDDLQTCLQSAFDHYSANLDTPFDFVQVALMNNPIPLDFSGNILRLAIAIYEHPRLSMDCRAIFKTLSPIVASCIMLDMARHRLLGPPEHLLDHRYMDSCEDVLDDFCNKYLPCVFSDCVNKKAGHGPKGHQNKNGKIIGLGAYESTFSADAYLGEWSNDLKQELRDIEQKLLARHKKGETTEGKAASDLHREYISGFYHRCSPASHFVSHSTCFCCLREPPEHSLPCGHVLCTPCLESYGDLTAKCVLELNSCPLHKTSWQEPYSIRIKPALAGVRVLSLDGGGMRGIVELEVLKTIESWLPEKIPIQAFFDLIVGTSTGGIIALGLGVKEWPLDICIDKFKNLCGKAFTPRRMQSIPGFQKIATLNHGNSRYKTKPLIEALQSCFGDEYLFGGPRADRKRCYGMKVALTATTDTGEHPVIFTNYNRQQLDTERLDYRFERSDKMQYEIKTWEAARATSAAPPYFKAFRNDRTGRGYLDGALYYNNPVRVADRERKLIWPDAEDIHPDVLVSIGTSQDKARSEKQKAKTVTFQQYIEPAETKGRKLIMMRSFINKPQLKSMLNVLINRVDSILDTQSAWDRFMTDKSCLDHDVRCRYQRLNPSIDRKPPALDKVGEIDKLQEEIQEAMSRVENQVRAKMIAYRLVASTFYFEKSHISNDNVCKGAILCRFPKESDQVRDLGNFLRKKSPGKFEPFIEIGEESPVTDPQVLKLNNEILKGMINHATFLLDNVQIPVSTDLAITTITICFEEGKKERFPISGFPRRLMIEKSKRVHQISEEGKLRHVARDMGRRMRTNTAERGYGSEISLISRRPSWHISLSESSTSL